MGDLVDGAIAAGYQNDVEPIGVGCLRQGGGMIRSLSGGGFYRPATGLQRGYGFG